MAGPAPLETAHAGGAEADTEPVEVCRDGWETRSDWIDVLVIAGSLLVIIAMLAATGVVVWALS
jgi:hypothetical protein